MIIECPKDIEKIWPEIEPIFKRAIDKTGGEYDTNDVKAILSNQQGLLWLIRTDERIQAAFITQILNLPQKRIGNVKFAAGDNLHEWRDIIHVFEAYFRQNGCDYFDIDGRRGWLKIYMNDGFKEQYVTIRKDLHG